MASILQVLGLLGPKPVLKPTAEIERIGEWLSMRTSLKVSEVLLLMRELLDCLLYFLRDGTPVRLPGVGTFTPSMDRAGVLNINFRADVTLKARLNDQGKYTGEILNRENIGITNEDLKRIWDSDHPDNPLQF